MSTIFGNGGSIPGCFAKEKMSGNVKGAVFNMGGHSRYAIVTGFDFTKSDDFAAVKCLGDVAYINLFGKSAIAELDVTLTLFLIKGRSHTGIISSYKKKFDGARLSAGHKNCSLTVGSHLVTSGYATSLTLRGDSSELGVAEATVHVVSLKDR